jgi:hypothetical protein
MKTAISIDDGLLRDADTTARLMGLSRSRLFARAMEDFLKRQKHEEMLRQLNEVYSQGPDAQEKALLKRIKAKAGAAIRERW